MSSFLTLGAVILSHDREGLRGEGNQSPRRGGRRSFFFSARLRLASTRRRFDAFVGLVLTRRGRLEVQPDEAEAQLVERDLLVAVLAPLLLARHHEAARAVDEADGGLRLVRVLAALAAGAERVHVALGEQGVVGVGDGDHKGPVASVRLGMKRRSTQSSTRRTRMTRTVAPIARR